MHPKPKSSFKEIKMVMHQKRIERNRQKYKNTEIFTYIRSWVTMRLMQRSKQELLLVMHDTMH